MENQTENQLFNIEYLTKRKDELYIELDDSTQKIARLQSIRNNLIQELDIIVILLAQYKLLKNIKNPKI